MKSPAIDYRTDWLQQYHEHGYHFPLRAFSANAARDYRKQLEAVETQCIDDPALGKIATGHANAVLPFVDAITRMPSVVDPVKAILGPDLNDVAAVRENKKLLDRILFK